MSILLLIACALVALAELNKVGHIEMTWPTGIIMAAILVIALALPFLADRWFMSR